MTSVSLFSSLFTGSQVFYFCNRVLRYHRTYSIHPCPFMPCHSHAVPSHPIILLLRSGWFVALAFHLSGLGGVAKFSRSHLGRRASLACAPFWALLKRRIELVCEIVLCPGTPESTSPMQLHSSNHTAWLDTSSVDFMEPVSADVFDLAAHLQISRRF
ncbi:hypothetical protein F5Y02DRAFT_71567 [Annulohypoxylon stygium]|nr:hypothetical protein F5Y02DRAFT_71567 [Annulohypoxylon stygium]